ncbi:phosphate-starvation-inducible PsiE family protein [Oceaniradius stylonematis]
MPIYEKFEQAVVYVLTGLIAVVVVAAVWNLLTTVIGGLILSGSFDPTDHRVFQSVFGMILTVIIALEFKRSILVIGERQFGIVQVRAVILIGLLAIVRKVIILDLGEIEPDKLFALAAGSLALGIVYWLVRDQDRKEREELPARQEDQNQTIS